MARKALEQIQAAETAAAEIRNTAMREADELRTEAHNQGKALRAEESAAIRIEKKQIREKAELQAESILERAKNAAASDAEALRVSAQSKLPEATALILERIRTLWQ